MIVNARMYSVTPAVGELWRQLLENTVRVSGGNHEVIDYPPPQPLGPLWARDDKAAVFMCGLPWSLSERDDGILVAPVPSPDAYGGQPIYWSYLVVPAESRHKSVRHTFGGRLALTTNESQSGYYAALHALMEIGGREPIFSELIGPTITVRENVLAVAEGRADLAPIDSYGFDLLSRHEPELTDRVRVVDATEATPIPMLVNSGAPSPELRDAFLAAHTDPANSEFLEELLLERFVVPSPEAYSAYPARRASVNAYWSLHRLSATENEGLAPNYS